jgi:hypothetical protein
MFAFSLNIVFNSNTMIKTDKEIIESLGGATEVANLLGYDLAKGGAQRVHNWISRGIPTRVKVDHPELFMNLTGAEKRHLSDRRAGRRKPEVK